MWPVIINGCGICYLLNVCVLSRYLSLIVEIWKCLCVVSLSQPNCRDLEMFVCCLVISA